MAEGEGEGAAFGRCAWLHGKKEAYVHVHGSMGPKAHAWPRKSRKARPRGQQSKPRRSRAAVGSWRRRPYEAEGDQSEADWVGIEAEAESGLLETEVEGSRGRAWLHAGRTEAEGSWLAGDGGRGESGTCMAPCRRTDRGRGELAAVGIGDGGRTRPRGSSPRPTPLGPRLRRNRACWRRRPRGVRDVHGSMQEDGPRPRGAGSGRERRRRPYEAEGEQSEADAVGIDAEAESGLLKMEAKGSWLAGDRGRGESGTCMAPCRRRGEASSIFVGLG